LSERGKVGGFKSALLQGGAQRIKRLMALLARFPGIKAECPLDS
jgi:hypothetical protein